MKKEKDGKSLLTYEGNCLLCGYKGIFVKNNPSFREGYQCPSCHSSLRYRGQAESILRLYSNNQYEFLAELAKDLNFSKLHIYEPGVIGPFRQLFSNFNNYTNSFYWDDVQLGGFKKGLRCESLEKLTFDDGQFDLVITSDILEHVRHPWVAFSDIFRVLKPGGYHIFSIPVHLPMRSKTFFRVDTTTEKDIYLEEPYYHGNGMGGRSLVYTEFGEDISCYLDNIGYEVTLDFPEGNYPYNNEIKRLITFVTRKP